MTEDGTIQEMIDKGVNKDIRIFPERFQKCSLCGEVFNQQNRLLLDCGHFMCEQCLKQMNRCTYPNCPNTSPQIKPYNSNKKNPVSQNSIFKFDMQCNGNRKMTRKEAKGTTTFGQLVSGNSFIEDYIKHYGSDKINVVLGSKQVKWLNIKDKKIYDLRAKCNIISASNAYNPFIIKQRYNGGNNI